MSDYSRSPPGYLALRSVAMPADANPNGDIFGGWLMSQMDVAGGLTARHRARGRVATIAVDAMEFHQPVAIGDEVSCFCEVLGVGQTSINVKVSVWVRRHLSGQEEKVTEGTYTYVAIDEAGNKRDMPSDG